jgi:nondiscriminating glutamyl-tRNA synthetase
MSQSPVVTRFAPSPTGEMHLGNVRTALFNALLARRSGGRFLLRVEDTDTARSRPEHAQLLQEDLRWLDLHWDGEPWYQSRRASVYDGQLAILQGRGLAYPCFCSPRELELARAAQLAAGRPPRYSGRCRHLSDAERAARPAAGEVASMRFAVPAEGAVEFVDLVHGPRHFAHAEIGDFVLRRADGSSAFFFSNAIDDALSGVTAVLRGDDHLSNTPRQLLILAALGLPVPQYGHLALLTGAGGAPLSKRDGSVSVRALRDEGLLPAALLNCLFRLGHSTAEQLVLSLDGMAAAFDTAHLQRSPAQFEHSRLLVWQKEVVHRLAHDEAERWLGDRIPQTLSPQQRQAFLSAVLPNVVLPDDATAWVKVAFGADPQLDADAAAAVSGVDRALFAAAAGAASGNEFAAIVAAAKQATGLKGPALFKPLRAALTGRLAGPELGPLLGAMPPGTAQRRLARFA